MGREAHGNGHGLCLQEVSSNKGASRFDSSEKLHDGHILEVVQEAARVERIPGVVSWREEEYCAQLQQEGVTNVRHRACH